MAKRGRPKDVRGYAVWGLGFQQEHFTRITDAKKRQKQLHNEGRSPNIMTRWKD
jgi:hypothetical protein